MKWLLLLSVLGFGGVLATPTVTTPERIRQYGYPVEEHTVKTSDGYILQLYRIPYSPRSNNQSVQNKTVAFLMHGLFSSSDCWIINGPENAIAFLLADAGYDVWMGNARGNVYSKKHATMSPASPSFWDFDWHEIGVVDLPAMIDYSLNKTQQQSLHYVGHSQGTTVFLVLLSSKPSYNNKFKSVHLLAPVAYMNHMKSPLAALLGPLLGLPLVTNELLGTSEFMPSTTLMSMLAPIVCDEESVVNSMCSNMLFMMGGFDTKYMNETLLADISETHPAGSSTRQMVHYLQEYNSGDFCQYDRGYFLNLISYKQSKPPHYKLENVHPLGETNLYYADNDYFVSTVDVDRLADRLTGKVNKLRVIFPEYNHMDVIWATNVKVVINDCVVDKINAHEGRPATGDKCNNFVK